MFTIEFAFGRTRNLQQMFYLCCCNILLLKYFFIKKNVIFNFH